MRRMPCAIAALYLILTASCSGDTPVGPGADPDIGSGTGTGQIRVLTQNVYVGADLDAVNATLLNGGDAGLALFLAINTLLANDLEARLGALADQIVSTRPQVVALQEVSRIDLAIPSPPFPAPVTLSQDFLTSLLTALQARGATYDVAVSHRNFSLDFTPLFGVPVRWEDHEVLLVERGVRVLGRSHGGYSCPPLCLALGFATIERGWVRIETSIAGRTVTFVGTHPESGDDPQIALLRAGQLQELAASLAAVNNPLIVMGDLNEPPGGAVSQVLDGAGFVDLWPAAGSGAGYTCCYDPDLRGGTLSKRIDYVLLRGGFETGNGQVIPGASIQPVAPLLTGSGLQRISDHAGLVATLPPQR